MQQDATPVASLHKSRGVIEMFILLSGDEVIIDYLIEYSAVKQMYDKVVLIVSSDCNNIILEVVI